MTELVIEKNARGHTAYLKDDPNTLGVGRKASDAVAALHTFIIGERILKEPELFGYSIEFKEA